MYSSRNKSSRTDGLLLWTVAILLLTGLAVALWVGGSHVFNNPEEHTSYHILRKIKRMDPPRRFELLRGAPEGRFLRPGQVMERFLEMDETALRDENARLIRDFLRNYDRSSQRVPYVTGTFTILDTRPLGESDFVQEGFVSLAQSNAEPGLFIEHIFPASADQADAAQAILKKGTPISLARTEDLSAVINIQRINDQTLLLTIMPLLYSSYQLETSGGVVNFQCDPPKTFNLREPWPVHGEAFELVATHAPVGARGRLAGLPNAPGLDRGAPEQQELPRIAQTTLPRAPQTTPVPADTQTDQPTAADLPADPAATPSTASEPAEAIASAEPSGPLQPFLPQGPVTRAPSGASAWDVYAAGEAPQAPLLEVTDISGRVEAGLPAGRVYLSGDFEVNASGPGRAILRNAQHPEIRVIVDYPPGLSPPAENTRVVSSQAVPFEIMSLERTQGDQINVWARAISAVP